MNVKKTRAEITNGNPRKEQGDDGQILAYDISTEFAVHREVVNELFPVEDFTGQFYSGDDTRLECVYPLTYAEKIEDLRVKLYPGTKAMEFEGAKIARNMKLTPQVGQYVKIECKLQVYPTRDQSGRLDELVKEFADVEIAPMTADLVRAVA